MANIPAGAVSSTSYSSAPSGSAGATYKTASGSLINSAGQTVGGAVTSKGISYNGTDTISGSSVYKADTIPGYSGAISNSNTEATIPATTIGNTAAYNIPAPVTQDYSKFLSGLNAGNLGTDQTAMSKAASVDSTSTGQYDLTKMYTDLLAQNKPESNVQAVKDIYGYNLAADQAKRAASEAQVQAKTQELSSIVANRDAQLQSLRQVGSQENVTEAIYGGQQLTINREAAIKALPVQAELEAAKGNLALAEKHLDTFFNAQMQDNKNDYEYKSKIIDVVMQGATKAEQRQYDAIQQANTRAYETEKANTEENKAWAKLMFTSGQPEKMSLFTSLDVKDPEYKQKLAAAQASVKNPLVDLEIANKKLANAKLAADTSLIAQGTAKEREAAKAASASALASIPQMYDKIATVDALKTQPGLEFRVGPNVQAREGIFIGIPGVAGLGSSVPSIVSEAKGEGQKFAGSVHQLVAGLSLQALIDAKARGATFGALSEGEMRILSNSASAINDWEIKDSKGNPTGKWNIDEESFKKELTTIQDLTKRAILLQQGNLVQKDEHAALDNFYRASGQALSDDSYYSNQ